ncbi:ciliary neurotrophic factor [Latimeria chalumnae]
MNLNPDVTYGIPTAATSHWSELTDAERLNSGLTAYRTFRSLLEEVLDEQRNNLNTEDLEFHQAISSVITQVEAVIEVIEQAMLSLDLPIPCHSDRKLENLSLFERKLRGYKVLLELSNWALRSVRDFSHLNKKRKEAAHLLRSSIARSTRRTSRADPPRN